MLTNVYTYVLMISQPVTRTVANSLWRSIIMRLLEGERRMMSSVVSAYRYLLVEVVRYNGWPIDTHYSELFYRINASCYVITWKLCSKACSDWQQQKHIIYALPILCEGNPRVTSGSPSQTANSAISWRLRVWWSSAKGSRFFPGPHALDYHGHIFRLCFFSKCNANVGAFI